MPPGNLGGEKEYQTLHRCVVAYASDFMLLGTALLPHGGHWYNPRVKMTVSLDHSMWFHAPFRADEWMLYVCVCVCVLVKGGGRR